MKRGTIGIDIHEPNQRQETRVSVTCSSSIVFYLYLTLSLLFLSLSSFPLSFLPSLPSSLSLFLSLGIYIPDLEPYFSIVSLSHHNAAPTSVDFAVHWHRPITPALPPPSPPSSDAKRAGSVIYNVYLFATNSMEARCQDHYHHRWSSYSLLFLSHFDSFRFPFPTFLNFDV